MNENEIIEELERDPFVPVRLHLVSGKTLDIVRQDVAWPLAGRLLVFRNPSRDRIGAEGYDIISYPNIERIEQLPMGKRTTSKRRPA